MSDFPLRPDQDEVMARTRAFVSSPRRGLALLHVRSVATIQAPSGRPLDSWRLPVEMKAYLDAGICRLRAYWAQRKEINDDLDEVSRVC